MKHNVEDTIAAIATPHGTGGVGVIRISGQKAKALFSRLFLPSNGTVAESHCMLHGWLIDPATQVRIDEVMACHMRAPKSFTGEDVAGVLEAWMGECGSSSDAPVFPSARGGHLSPDAIERLIAKHAATAARFCPSLATKRITPHTLRHSAAMALLRNGVDRSVIALWLGHESIETTQMYLHADMRMKEEALARTSSSNQKPQRYQPDDALLAFLDGL